MQPNLPENNYQMKKKITFFIIIISKWHYVEYLKKKFRKKNKNNDKNKTNLTHMKHDNCWWPPTTLIYEFIFFCFVFCFHLKIIKTLIWQKFSNHNHVLNHEFEKKNYFHQSNYWFGKNRSNSFTSSIKKNNYSGQIDGEKKTMTKVV